MTCAPSNTTLSQIVKYLIYALQQWTNVYKMSEETYGTIISVLTTNRWFLQVVATTGRYQDVTLELFVHVAFARTIGTVEIHGTVKDTHTALKRWHHCICEL